MALIPIDGIPRRELFTKVALAVVAMETSPLVDAQEVHKHANQEKSRTGTYKPKLFNEHEYETVARLAELIVPADDISGSAADAGAAEFIDLLASHNERLADIFTGGIGWIDSYARTRYGTTFLEAGQERQVVILEQLVRARRQSGVSETEAGYLIPGVNFFDWMRRMAIDAFYTSPIGIKDVGYLGNSASSRYTVPQEAIDYALKRSPLP